MNCLKCHEDISVLMNWDTLSDEFIECPKCKNKMKLQWDEFYDSETNEEFDCWWLDQI